MIIEALRRRWVRYFGPRATSVSSQIEPRRDPIGYTATIQYVGAPWSLPSSALQVSEPSKAAATSGGPSVTPWTEWEKQVKTHYIPPGWTFCKMGVRGPGPDNLGEVWGIVRDGFGAYWCKFYVAAGAEQGPNALAVAINAHTGYALGIFPNLIQACEAIDIVRRLSGRAGLDQDPDVPESNQVRNHLTDALSAAGFSQGQVFCRPMVGDDVVRGLPIPVWMRPEPMRPLEAVLS